MSRWHIIIVFACILHFVQAIALYFDPSVLGITSIYTVGRVIGIPATLAGFVIVAGLAAWSLTFSSSWPKAGLLLPQQVVLLFNAAGALHFMYLSHYADGVVRSHGFIIADQMSTVLLALGHAWAIIEIWHGDANARSR